MGSMIETGVQGVLAIEAAPQQQEQLSINQQAQRWTVQMYASRLGLPAAACTASKLKEVGAVASKIWCRERLLPSIEKQSDGSLVKVQFQAGSNTAERDVFLPEQDPHLLAKARMKYSLAYKGGYEAADRSNSDMAAICTTEQEKVSVTRDSGFGDAPTPSRCVRSVIYMFLYVR